MGREESRWCLSYEEGNDRVNLIDAYNVLAGIDVAGSDFSTRGDSGSLLVDASSEAIGLVFAAATGIDLTVANPIDKVFAYFGVQPL
jgi:hypothetical protein